METKLWMYVINHFKEEGKPRLCRCSFRTLKDSCREKSFSDRIWFLVTISGPRALPLCRLVGCKGTWSSLLTSWHVEIPWKALAPFPWSYSFIKSPRPFSWEGWEEHLCGVYCLPSRVVTFLPLLPVPIPCPCDRALKGESCPSIHLLEMVQVVGRYIGFAH